jgi:hypothetical protein
MIIFMIVSKKKEASKNKPNAGYQSGCEGIRVTSEETRTR